jgi:hypothetical protein
MSTGRQNVNFEAEELDFARKVERMTGDKFLACENTLMATKIPKKHPFNLA